MHAFKTNTKRILMDKKWLNEQAATAAATSASPVKDKIAWEKYLARNAYVISLSGDAYRYAAI